MVWPKFSLLGLLAVITLLAGLFAWLATATPEVPPDAQFHRLVTLIRDINVPSVDPPVWERRLVPLSALLMMGAVGAAWGLQASRPDDPVRQRAARWFWTLGLLLYAAHVALAFDALHQWSHREAAVHVGLRTHEMSGWYWEGGIWINYLFGLVWLVDAAWWWRGLDPYRRRPAWLRLAVSGFFLTMIFFAGVVFAPPLTRWITVAGLLTVLAVAALARWRAWLLSA